MNLAEISIKRPVFITSVLLLTIIAGLFFMRDMGISLYPDVNMPFITVITPYPGAGPDDIDSGVTKPLEKSISSTAGLKKLTSQSKDGTSVIMAEFTMETDEKFALQQVRDRVAAVRSDLPQGVLEPSVALFNMNDAPILTLTLAAGMGERELFDLAEYTIRPRLEHVRGVGRVEIQGGRKREVRVQLDRAKLAAYEISATETAAALASSGRNVAAGRKTANGRDRLYRVMGEFKTPGDVDNTMVRFTGNDVPVRIKDLGKATDGYAEEDTISFRNGRKSMVIAVYKQSRTNTVKAASITKQEVTKLQKELSTAPGKPELQIVQDGTRAIAANVTDLKETILVSILLTVLVVLLFLRNLRSTIITVLAIPNSIIGAFALMYFAGFTVNIMSLLALSLSIGILVDDAIVVRENIFRRMQAGEPPAEAARKGAEEVRLAVIATSLTVAAVFLPIAFMKGVVGQYFREFGLTVCFVLLISTFDSLTIAPMLSAYFSGGAVAPGAGEGRRGGLVRVYRRLLCACLRRPVIVLAAGAILFAASIWAAKGIPSVFIPPQENGEFYISLEGAPDLGVSAMAERALTVDTFLRSDADVANTLLVAGGRDGESNKASIFVELKPAGQRKLSTSQTQVRLREKLKPFAPFNPILTDAGESGMDRAIAIVISGEDAAALAAFSSSFYERFKKHPSIADPELSEKPGKPEIRISLDPDRALLAGISPAAAGEELRIQLEGQKAAKLRDGIREYDIRVPVSYTHLTLPTKRIV